MALRRGHLECGANCWPGAMTSSQHVYEVSPRKDHRGVDRYDLTRVRVAGFPIGFPPRVGKPGFL